MDGTHTWKGVSMFLAEELKKGTNWENIKTCLDRVKDEPNDVGNEDVAKAYETDSNVKETCSDIGIDVEAMVWSIHTYWNQCD